MDEQVQSREGHVADAREVVAVGVERVLEEAQGRRRVGRDLAGVFAGLVEQLVRLDDIVDQAPALGRLRVVEVEEEPDLARPLLPDHAREIGRAVTGIEGPDPRAGLAEAGSRRRDREVTEHMQHVPATDSHTVDGRDDRLGQGAHEFVEVLDLEESRLGLAIGTGGCPLLDVTPGAEGLVAGAGEDHRRDALVSPCVLEGCDELIDGPSAERVVALGTIDRHDGVGVLFDHVGDVGEFLGLQHRVARFSSSGTARDTGPRRAPHVYDGLLTVVRSIATLFPPPLAIGGPS